jgi:hypothetical protein
MGCFQRWKTRTNQAVLRNRLIEKGDWTDSRIVDEAGFIPAEAPGECTAGVKPAPPAGSLEERIHATLNRKMHPTRIRFGGKGLPLPADPA